MFRVIGCIVEQHDLRLVLLAAALCVLASGTGVSMLARARAAAGRVRAGWIVAAAAACASGIWGTHFVAMLAYQPKLPVGYDIGLTLLSVIVAAVLCAAGFAVALRRNGAILGGLIVGGAVSAMHFVGMAAVDMPARAIWSADLVIASVAIGLALGAAAMHVALRRADIRAYTLGAGLLIVAICGMHFTAMAAVAYLPDPTVSMPETVLAPGMLAIVIAAVSAFVVGLGLISALVDSHLAGRSSQEAARLRASIAELEATKLRLETISFELTGALSDADAANQSLAAVAEEKEAAAKAQAEVVEGLAFGLSRLASGELAFRLSEPFPDGYELLRRDFNTAMDQLQETMTLVKASVQGLHSRADEMAQAAEGLSRRAEHQAANLEESSSALEDITGAMRRTADGAASVSNLVAGAMVEARRSGEVMGQTQHAMGAIERSSGQIAQIVGVIDEIAFQTNLLALNAGIEAARAGESGRGFAVIAVEVRALAQRSAEAAQEIKALIADSTLQVGAGVDLVSRTGEALACILADIDQINTLAGDFAAAAKQQSLSLMEVNRTVDQIGHVTQQNASMAEETTAASYVLTQESEYLSDLLGRFELAPPEPPAPLRLVAGR